MAFLAEHSIHGLKSADVKQKSLSHAVKRLFSGEKAAGNKGTTFLFIQSHKYWKFEFKYFLVVNTCTCHLQKS